jgi:membrane-associated protease RseP (regulator of RpoE activity)
VNDDPRLRLGAAPDGVSPPRTDVLPVDLWAAPPVRPKFQHRYTPHIVLFLLTFLTTTFKEAFWYAFYAVEAGSAGPSQYFTAATFVQGLWYSLPVLAILGAHEFGHYILCRRHQVDASLPYFLPAPLPLTGTLGAVIRIRQAFPSKRALFDIGVAGPIAGFIVALPFLYLGIVLSDVRPTANYAGLYFGEPLLFKAFAQLHFGAIPEGHDIFLHPMGMAAWFGLLATALNLMPFGQLDGGHLVYSLVGRKSSYVSLATIIGAILLTIRSPSWIVVTLMMLAMAFVLGLRHPRVMDEETPLDPGRRLVFVFAVVMFALCFTPVPIQMFFGS